MDETGNIIRRLVAGGLSQAEIARRTEIPQPRLSRWASGAVPVGANDALKLAALAEALSKQVLPFPAEPADAHTEERS